MNTKDLEWFGLPERNTLRPLCVVLPYFERVCECLGEPVCDLGSLSCTASASLLYLKGGAYMAAGTPTGGPSDVV